MSWIENLQEVFGFSYKKATQPEQETFTLEREELADGLSIEMGPAGGISQLSYENTVIPADERDLINSCRMIAQSSDVDEALNEIRNEIFIYDVPGDRAFELSFSEEDGAPSEKIQEKIIEEFRELYEAMNFQHRGPQLFDEWYINGKLFLQKLVDKDHPKEGITGVIVVDPLKIRKVRILPRPDVSGTIDKSQIKELYVFNNIYSTQTGTYAPISDVTFGTTINGLQITPDAICHIDSGCYDYTLGRYVSWLKKAILPYNNLRMMEDAMLIFRVVRAPMRRVFYIDVASLQKNKAEEYMKSMMNRFKVKMIYDTKTGAMSDRRNIQSMMEDYWLPRRDGGRATEVQNLEGQDSNNILEEVNYYKNKLYRALNVPISRFSDNPAPFVFGRGIEIQRDEYRFKKFLDKLRQFFMRIWDDLLRTQLVLKGVITDDEWQDIRRYIFWNYAEDNAFVELKESELLNNRVALLQAMDPFVGKYFTKGYVRRKVLRQDDDEMKQLDKEMKKELAEDPTSDLEQMSQQQEIDHADETHGLDMEMQKAKIANVKKHGNSGSPKPKDVKSAS